MVIIAFSHKTSKILPRIVCHRFRHCAPIIQNGGTMTMYQFTRPGKITAININSRAIRRLAANGWRFIYVPCNPSHTIDIHRAITCVDLSKRALGITAPFVQTPDGLYRYIGK